MTFEPALSWYFRALAGRDCELVPYADDGDVWQHPDTATTVRLPSSAPVDDAAGWYRVALTHRALHHALGTFGWDLAGFLRRFGRTALAVEVFAVLEDLRVDAAARRLFPGLAPVYDRVRAAALAGRHAPAGLPPRSALAEALVRQSLGAAAVAVPESLHAPLARIAAAARPLAAAGATVADTAEATMRVYGVLAGQPNVGVAAGPPAALAFAFAGAVADPAPAFTGELRLEGDEVLDVRPAPVRYRDVPGPRYLGQQSSGMPLREMILRMTPAGQEPADTYVARALAAERGEPPPEPLPHDHGPDLDGHHHGPHGPLRAAGRDEYVYPEWDATAGRYLRDWCLVRVRRLRPGRPGRRGGRPPTGLLAKLVAQLERIRPAGRDLLTRLPDGDDLDFDACVEALVDLRAGASPGDRVHTSSVDRRRDVAVAFAVDLSSSTAERLPDDSRRIIDVERDAVTLLVEALERVGDSYGVYGFSGTGRGDVRLSVVKDLDERRSPVTARRLAGLAPDHTTRMGPAVRHLTARLARHPASTRLLIVVSDGRPYDVDYEQGYAVADTARALAEARAAGVRPYLITVDPAGADYLGEMCDPAGYHVVADTGELPAALAQLYVVAAATGASAYPVAFSK